MRTPLAIVLSLMSTQCSRPETPPAERENRVVPPAPREPAMVTPIPSSPLPSSPLSSSPLPSSPISATKPPQPTTPSLVEGLEVAWYDPDEGFLHILCDEDDRTADERTPCTTEAKSVFVIDAEGTNPWQVIKRESKHSATLELSGGTLPPPRTPVLVLLDEPPAVNARLTPVRLSKPSRTRSVKTLATMSDYAWKSEFEIHGNFGNGADTLAVLETLPPDDGGEEGDGDWELRVIAAFRGSDMIEVFGDEDDEYTLSYYAIAGTMDLDADGVSESLWWGVGEGFGISLFVVWFGEGEHHITTLYSCECGNYLTPPGFRIPRRR